MSADICFFLSLAVLLIGFGTAFACHRSPNRRGKIFSPVRCLLVSIFLACVFLFFPLHLLQFPKGFWGSFKSLLLAVHSTMRLFVLDGEFDGMAAFTEQLPQKLQLGYSLLAAALYILAPIFTFGFVLSFFKNISAYRALIFSPASEVYAFSELNEKALVLAKSIREKKPRSLIVFTDVFENNEETIFELCEKARALHAVWFRKDIADINWKYRSMSSQIYLFTIGEDQSENVEQSIRLLHTYEKCSNFHLFVFSSSAESQVLFNAVREGGMYVRRIDPIRSLISQMLYRNGYALFEHAISTESTRLISVVIIGLGQYGKELLKALPWFCQMDGYQVQIHAFDRDLQAESKFRMSCPELLDPEKNGTYVAGEAQYSITIHSGVDVDTAEFADSLRSIGPISCIFVALGEDGRNIQSALTARMLCARNGQHPQIQAIVYNSLKKKALETITDYRGHPYDITFIGDLESSYAEDVIIDSELEQNAIRRHLKWGKELEFWAYEFNYRSSIAAAIHEKMRVLCGIPGAGKRAEELSPAERIGLEQLEHRRWNAYMRSEGYVFSGSTAPESRNDLAKLHHDLVPFELLSQEEKQKDLMMSTK